MKTRIVKFTFGGSWTLPLDTTTEGLDSSSTVLFVFGASRFLEAPEPLVELRRRFPRAVMIGCSTAGEIQDGKVFDDSIVAAVVRFEATLVRGATLPIRSTSDSSAVGEALARELAAPDLSGLFVLSAGRTVNGSELIAGINRAVASSVVVTGGLAGDGERFGRTWVIADGSPREDHVSAVGFYGDRVAIRHGSRGGWDMFGPERKVTRATGNVLYELDGKPALQLYKEYLGERAAELPASALLFPLAIRPLAAEGQRVRTILQVDEDTQSLTFAGDVPVGASARLMRANFDRLVQGASDAAAMARGPSGESEVLSIAISCVGRRLLLRQRVEEELEAALEGMPPGTHQVGFYSYGELSPLVAGGACELQNQTMTLTTLEER